MYQFAERVGWKMQKRDEDLVQEFCNEIGIDKGVLKVWMHNNKNTFAKRDVNGNVIRSGISNLDTSEDNDGKNTTTPTTTTTATTSNINNNGSENANHHHHNHNLNHHQFEEDGHGIAHGGVNGSSSSC